MKIYWLRAVGYGALGLLVLLLVSVVTLSLMDWNRLRGPVGRVASIHLGREVTIAGPLQVHLWSRTPSVAVTDLQIANPPWETRDRFVQIEHLQIELDLRALLHGHLILSSVTLIHPAVYLHRDKSGRANWTFQDTAPSDDQAPAPIKLPAVENILIDQGKLVVVDELRRMNITGTIEAHEDATASDVRPFRIVGRGSLNNEPLQFMVSGGALLAINPEHPYPFTLSMQALQHEIKVEGEVLKPFDLAGLDLRVEARGTDMAELYYLTQLALPNTPPYQVRAHIQRNGQHFEIRDIKALLGATDMGGTVDVDASRRRPSVVAKLYSRHLYMKDLGAVTGSRVGAQTSSAAPATGSGAKAAVPTPADHVARLFPDAHLQVNRVQGMDAELTFTASAITAGVLPFTDARVAMTLKDGILTVHHARFDLPQGRLSGLVSIDTHPRVPVVHMDVRATDVELDQIKGKAPTASPPLGGTFQARAIIDGKGDSVRAVMADANGTVTGVIPHGDIRAAFAELTGVDIAKGVGLLLTKSEDRASIHCGLAQFDIRHGTAHADRVVMDTQNVLITGGGQIELGSEKLDLRIQGHPKKFRLVRLRSPIEIQGHMLKPTFKLEGGHLVRQVGVAAALGTLLTPFATIYPAQYRPAQLMQAGKGKLHFRLDPGRPDNLEARGTLGRVPH